MRTIEEIAELFILQRELSEEEKPTVDITADESYELLKHWVQTHWDDHLSPFYGKLVLGSRGRVRTSPWRVYEQRPDRTILIGFLQEIEE